MASGCVVLKPGASTTLQDLGRRSYMRYGVSVSGAADAYALRVGNLLAGNFDDGLAALEVTLTGPRLEAQTRLGIAITGADLGPRVNNVDVPMWRFLILEPGDQLSFGAARFGCRSYLCFTGGIDVPQELGSRSTHTRAGIGGIPRALIGGDFLPVSPLPSTYARSLLRNVLGSFEIPDYTGECVLDALPGPQEEQFFAEAIQRFYQLPYRVTPHADRMGYRLAGDVLERQVQNELITEATPPGSVQVSHDGMPIVLLPDASVTGGYPKIAIITTPALHRLAQVRPGDTVRFRRSAIESAHQALRARQDGMDRLRRRLTTVQYRPAPHRSHGVKA